MLENMPKLEREPMRPEEEPGFDKPIWKPTWKCFCCHDVGIVWSYLASIVIEGYDFSRDKIPLCQNPNCHAGDHLIKNPLTRSCLDLRLNASICQKLDEFERDTWEKWARERQEKSKEINAKVVALADAKSLRERARTPSEELEVQQKHEEVRAQ